MVFSTYTQIGGGRSSPGPAKTFVFLDQRDDRVNWGNYMANMTGYEPYNPSQFTFTQDVPGTYHNNACGFSFADGHAEIKKWRRVDLMPPYDPSNQSDWPAPDDPDIYWIQDHTTRRR